MFAVFNNEIGCVSLPVNDIIDIQYNKFDYTITIQDKNYESETIYYAMKDSKYAESLMEDFIKNNSEEFIYINGEWNSIILRKKDISKVQSDKTFLNILTKNFDAYSLQIFGEIDKFETAGLNDDGMYNANIEAYRIVQELNKNNFK